MNQWILALLLILYFGVLLYISWATSKNATTDSFFSGDKKSPWFLVAFGMIGTSLSGVTFVSVPGKVMNSGWHYYQLVLGFFIGYFVVAYVLLPIYYKLKLTSIYSYLEQRFGINAYQWGAGYFILSRTLGATVRLYLVINVLQLFIFDALGIPFWLSTLIIIKRRCKNHCLDGHTSNDLHASCLVGLFVLPSIGTTPFLESNAK